MLYYDFLQQHEIILRLQLKLSDNKKEYFLEEKIKEWTKEKIIELTVYSFNLNTVKFYEKNDFNELSKKMTH